MYPAAYDNTLLRELVPGWHPRVTLTDGLASAVGRFEADAGRQQIDNMTDAVQDHLGRIYRRALAAARHQ